MLQNLIDKSNGMDRKSGQYLSHPQYWWGWLMVDEKEIHGEWWSHVPLLCYATNHGELCAPRATTNYCSNTNLAKQHVHGGYFGTLTACGRGVVHVRVLKRSAMARFRVSAFLTPLQEMLICSQAV